MRTQPRCLTAALPEQRTRSLPYLKSARAAALPGAAFALSSRAYGGAVRTAAHRYVSAVPPHSGSLHIGDAAATRVQGF
jgi:hypothetical protein